MHYASSPCWPSMVAQLPARLSRISSPNILYRKLWCCRTLNYGIFMGYLKIRGISAACLCSKDVSSVCGCFAIHACSIIKHWAFRAICTNMLKVCFLISSLSVVVDWVFIEINRFRSSCITDCVWHLQWLSPMIESTV